MKETSNEEKNDNKEVDATTSLINSSRTCETKEVMPMDIPTLTITLTNSRAKHDNKKIN